MKHLSLVTVVWLAGSQALASVNCPEGTQELLVSELVPTQLEYSQTVVEEIYQGYRDDVKPDVPLLQVFRRRFAERPLPVVVGPGADTSKRHYYLLDNHHTTIPLQLAVDEHLIKPEEALVCIVIRPLEGFAEGDGWEPFIEALRGAAIGYFGKERAQRLTNESLSLDEAYRDLFAHRLTTLTNNTLRGGVGKIMGGRGVKGRFFVDYIEFLIAERLAPRFPDFNDNDPASMARLEGAIWEDKELLAFLLAKARDPKVAKERIDAAIARWHREQDEERAGSLPAARPD